MAESCLTFTSSQLFDILNANTAYLHSICNIIGLSADGSKEDLRLNILKYLGSLPQEEISRRYVLPIFANQEHVVEEDYSDELSVVDLSNRGELEARTNIFLQNMKDQLIRKATDMRLRGKVKNPRMLSKLVLAEQVASSLLLKEFRSTDDDKTHDPTVSYEIFCKLVLQAVFNHVR